jgi:hypothetical protein
MRSTRTGPHVVVMGGFLTEPFHYGSMAQRLRSRGAARVSVASIHLPDWAVMAFAGMGPLMLRGARAIHDARRQAPEPLLVVGHSLGGVVARLAVSGEPFEGRRADVAADVACLVTLGSPHRFRPRIPWRHPAVRATEHLAAIAARSPEAPSIPVLTVGSTWVDPLRRRRVRGIDELLARTLLAFVGETPGERGDGLVGNDLCQLEGARHIALPDVIHGVFGSPWYGDEEVIDRWWPVALDLWRQSPAGTEAPALAGTEAPAPAGRIVSRSAWSPSSVKPPKLAVRTMPSASMKKDVGMATPR